MWTGITGEHAWARHLGRLAEAAYDRWRPVLIGLALLLVVLPPLIGSLELDADSSRLVSPTDPLARAYRENRDLFGEPNPVLLRLSVPGVSTEVLDALVNRFVVAVGRWSDIAAIGEYPGDPTTTGNAHLRLRRALLAADEASFQEFLERFQEDGMRRRLLLSRRAMVAIDDPALRRRLADDLLGLRELLDEGGGVAQAGFLSGPQSTAVRLVVIRPRGSAEDGGYCRSLFARLDQELAALGAILVPEGRIDHGWAGVHAITADSARILGQDLVRITLLAASLLLVLLLAAMRDPRAVLCCLAPLAGSLSAIVLLARTAFSSLNTLTVGFAAVVLGLGLDAALHLVARYLRQAGDLEPRAALVRTYIDCGPPLVVGTTTTAAAFLSLLLVGTPGLAQFALLVALGLLVTLAITLLTLPALIHWLQPENRRTTHRFARGSAAARWPTLGATRPGLATGLSLLMVATAGWLARDFHLETDILRLAPNELPSVRTARRLAEEGLPEISSLVQVRLAGHDASRLADAQEQLDRVLEELRKESVVVAWDSPSQGMPRVVDPIRARRRMDQARAAVEGSGARLTRMVDELGFRTGLELAATIRMVEGAVSFSGELADPWLDPGELRQGSGRAMILGDDASFLLTSVWPAASSELGSAGPGKALLEAIEGLRPPSGIEVSITGTTLLYQRANDRIRESLLRTSLVALGVVASLLALFFGSLTRTMAALLPLLAALVFTMGLTTLLEVEITPSILPFAAVVVGIGIDDAVHLLARAGRSRPTSLRSPLSEIGPVITLTSLSSAIGFGALTISRLPVVASLGVVVALGVLACWFFSLYLLPGMLRLLERRVVATAACVLLALAATMSAAAVEGDPAEARSREILERIAARAQARQAVSCELTQTKVIEQLTGEVRLTGHLLFQPPGSFRIEVSGDESYGLLSDGRTIWLVDSELETIRELPIAEARSHRMLSRLLPPFLATTMDELLTRFQAIYGGREDKLEVVTLVPRSAATESYRDIRLLVDGRARVRWAVIRYPNGDRVETSFSRWRRGPMLSEARFRPSPEQLAWSTR